MISHLLRTCIVVALPVGCIFFADHLAGPAAPRLEDKVIGVLCLLDAAAPDREISCLAKDWVGTFRNMAWVALGLGLLPVVLFFSAARICGASRWLNAVVFRRLIPVAIAVICINLLIQGLLLLIAVVLFYAAFLGRPPIMVLVATAGAIAAGAIGMVSGALTLRFEPELPVRGMALKRDAAPRLWSVVDGLAKALGAESPDAIVIGLEPTFWVIAGDVRLHGKPLTGGLLKGRTLYVSLPLMHVLSDGEFRAIIGHELGHFRGRDSEYSARFVPAYQALAGAEHGLEEAGDVSDSAPALAMLLAWISRLPVRAQLRMLGGAFHGNVQRISRVREYEADAAAAEVADPRAVATSLFKIPLYAQLWEDLVEDHISRVRLDRPSAPELGRHFGDMARLLVTPQNAVELREYALEARAEHPFDSHPSSFNRTVALGLDPAEVTADELRADTIEGVAEPLIDKLDEIEFLLTAAENEALQQDGLIPQAPATLRNEKTDPLYYAAYSILAALVYYAPDPAVRFTGLVRRAQETMQRFDRLAFARYCRGHDAVLPADQAAAEIAERAGMGGLAKVAEAAAGAINDSGIPPNAEEMEILALLDPRATASRPHGEPPEATRPAPTAANEGPAPDPTAIHGWLRGVLDADPGSAPDQGDFDDDASDAMGAADGSDRS